MYLAFIKGQKQVRLDKMAGSIQTGFYAGYYSGFSSRRRKSPQELLKVLYRDEDREVPDVDVESFEQMEARFNERAKHNKVKRIGTGVQRR